MTTSHTPSCAFSIETRQIHAPAHFQPYTRVLAFWPWTSTGALSSQYPRKFEGAVCFRSKALAQQKPLGPAGQAPARKSPTCTSIRAIMFGLEFGLRTGVGLVSRGVPQRYPNGRPLSRVPHLTPTYSSCPILILYTVRALTLSPGLLGLINCHK